MHRKKKRTNTSHSSKGRRGLIVKLQNSLALRRKNSYKKLTVKIIPLNYIIFVLSCGKRGKTGKLLNINPKATRSGVILIVLLL